MSTFADALDTSFATPAEMAAVAMVIRSMDSLVHDGVITRLEADRMLAVWITTRLTEPEVVVPKDYETEDVGPMLHMNYGCDDYETGDGS